MSSIAARLGGSKGTLYNYFDSKEALFEAYIRESCGRVGAEILDFADERPVHEVLRQFGEQFLDRIYSDWAVRTFQIVVAEARRSPELARLFFESGPMVVTTACRNTSRRRGLAAKSRSMIAVKRPGNFSACAASIISR